MEYQTNLKIHLDECVKKGHPEVPLFFRVGDIPVTSAEKG